MTPEIEEPPTPAPAAAAQGPGAIIRQSRERRGLSLEDLAAQTKLARGTLDALERDDFSSLLEPVYVRGYYRKCAKVLDVPEKGLIEAYENRVVQRAPSPPSKLRLASGTDHGSDNRVPVWIGVVIALVAVVLISVAWFARERQQYVPPSVAARAGTVPGPAETGGTGTAPPDAQPGPEQVQQPVDAGIGAATIGVPSVGAPPDATTEPVPAPQAGATPAPVAPPAAASSAGAKPLKMSFAVTSWVRIDDAGGRTLLNDLVRAGEERNLSGAAPLSVFLGNAPGVTVEFDGQPVDISGATRDNNTARFKLPMR